MTSLRENYDKHVVVTIIVLVGLPILLSSSSFIILNQGYVITEFFPQVFSTEIGVRIGVQFVTSLGLLQYVIFIVMLILYPVYPLSFSLESHLNKRKPERAIFEYKVVKRIIYVLFPMFVLAVALITFEAIQENPLKYIIGSLDYVTESILISILAAIFFAFASALLRNILLNSRKHFKFYLARLCLKAMSRVEDDLERMNYLIEGLGFYNRYIRRTLGLQINDPKIIYSKIIADGALDRNYIMKELCEAFKDCDKLKPIRCLAVLLDIPNPEHFLVKESIGKRLEDWGGTIGTLASTITAVVGAVAALLTI
jgi:hypothetical protein